MRNVFITGIFRSGTSLISTALNAHNNIVIGWQPYWLFFKTCRNNFYKEVLKKPIDMDYPMGILQFTSRQEKKLFRDIFDRVNFSAEEIDFTIAEIRRYLSAQEDKINKRMKPVRLADYLGGLEPGTAGHILCQLLERLCSYHINTDKKVRDAGDIKIAGIKEVFCEEYIEPILRFKELDSAAIHIIRDPRGVAASRNYGKYMEEAGSKYPLFFVIRSWKRSVASALSNKGSENYLMIKYEDLVGQPKVTLKHICDVLGVEFSEDLLDFNKYRDSDGKQWEPNSSFESSRSINISSIAKWKNVLSQREIEVIEYFCRSELEYLGYERTVEHFNEERIFDFREEANSISEWLREYDFSYKTNRSSSTAVM
jgi:hypothetical protein